MKQFFDRFRSSAHRLHVVPSDVLRQKSTAFSSDGAVREANESFVRDMTHIMRTNGGVGIAAPQIGVTQRVFCMEDREHTHLPLITCFNPRIVRARGSQITAESCLSVPDQIGFVRRARSVRLLYTDEDAQKQSVDLQGFWAVVAQHEVDHLDGVLFTDKLMSRLWSGGEFEQLEIDELRAEPGLADLVLSLESKARFLNGKQLQFP